MRTGCDIGVQGRDSNLQACADVALAVNHLDSRLTVAVIADGMGGLPEPREAALLAATVALSEVTEPPHDPRAAVVQANEALIKRFGMNRVGAAIVCCSLVDQQLTVANVGDCRAGLIDQGRQVRWVSVDHTSLARRFGSNPSPAEARQEAALANHLYLSLGERTLSIDEPHQSAHRLTSHDAVLLCSDGFWGALDAQIAAELANRSPLSGLVARASRITRDDAAACLLYPLVAKPKLTSDPTT